MNLQARHVNSNSATRNETVRRKGEPQNTESAGLRSVSARRIYLVSDGLGESRSAILREGHV